MFDHPFQPELAVTKQMNTELTKRIETLERQCWANAQYSRKECLEVVGIPRQADDNLFETKTLSIFEKVAQLILVLLMTVIALARTVTEL